MIFLRLFAGPALSILLFMPKTVKIDVKIYGLQGYQIGKNGQVKKLFTGDFFISIEKEIFYGRIYSTLWQLVGMNIEGHRRHSKQWE